MNDTDLLFECYKDVLNSSMSVVQESLVIVPIKIDDKIYASITSNTNSTRDTYSVKKQISNSGFFQWSKSFNRWISKDGYNNFDEYKKNYPWMKRLLFPLSKDISEQEFDNIAMGRQSGSDEQGDPQIEQPQSFNDKVKEYINELKEKIKNNIDSPEIQAFLNFRKKFTKRSFNNQILIFLQSGGTATHVEGFNTWKNKFGRRVKKGGKAIKIFAPITGRRRNEDVPEEDEKVNELERPTRFILVPVYDILDTEPIPGKEHKYVETPKWWDDTTPDETTKFIYDALINFAKENNIKVTVSAEGLGGAKGVSKLGDIQIAIENISTLIHELTHEILHTKEVRHDPKHKYDIGELQAEGVAYTVLRHYDLPTSHSEIYLTLWKADPDKIQQNETIIINTAKRFIEYIDNSVSDESSPVSTEEVKDDATPEGFKESFKSFYYNERHRVLKEKFMPTFEEYKEITDELRKDVADFVNKWCINEPPTELEVDFSLRRWARFYIKKAIDNQKFEYLHGPTADPHLKNLLDKIDLLPEEAKESIKRIINISEKMDELGEDIQQSIENAQSEPEYTRDDIIKWEKMVKNTNTEIEDELDEWILPPDERILDPSEIVNIDKPWIIAYNEGIKKRNSYPKN